MRVERLLQINVAILTALSSFMVGIGLDDALLPLVVLTSAMISVWITDITGKLALGRTAARLAMIAAVAISIPGAIRLERETLIVTVAWYLAYLQIIHFFQRKDPRTYSLLLRLSLLQVVVAAVLSQGSLFGLMLVVYLFTALSALFACFLHAERLGSQRAEARAGPASPSRWPLIRQQPTCSCPTIGRVLVEREMFFRVFRMGLATLALCAMAFFTIPRMGQGAWRGMRGSVRSSVGFSEKVTLGELGMVLQNPEEVLRLSLYDNVTGKPYQVDEDLYLRGALLVQYQKGQWTLPPRRNAPLPAVEKLIRTSLGEPLVRQEIAIEPTQREELFCVWPYVLLHPGDPHLVPDPQYERLTRPAELTRQRFGYELGTPAFKDGIQSAIVPTYEWVPGGGWLLQMPQENGRSTVPALEALAARWLDESGPPAEDRCGRARYLERKLRESGRFQYSLEGQGRDPEIDPVEDFIANHPRGHCEYFATALALMLRSQAIPARVVVGYRSGEWNDVGERFLQVRQLHAHTWVEAYLTRGQLPEEVKDRTSPRWLGGGWLRLDATPAGAGDETARSFWVRGPGKYLNWLDFAWSNYVMQMDRPRQRQAIYSPLTEMLQRAARALTNPGWWRQTLGGLTRALGLDRWHQPGGPWFHWRAFLLVVLGGGLVVLILALIGKRSLRQRWLALRRRGKDLTLQGERVKVEFYRRLEAVLGRHGLVRPPSRTPREFALAAGRQMAERLGDEQLGPLPVQVAEAYYRVRFGGGVLDNSQVEAVEQALETLERAVDRRNQAEGDETRVRN